MFLASRRVLLLAIESLLQECLLGNNSVVLPYQCLNETDRLLTRFINFACHYVCVYNSIPTEEANFYSQIADRLSAKLRLTKAVFCASTSDGDGDDNPY